MKKVFRGMLPEGSLPRTAPQLAAGRQRDLGPETFFYHTFCNGSQRLGKN